MRLVLDTNVLVSALFWDGNEWRALQACMRGDHALILSPAILDELQRILIEKFEVPDADVGEYLLHLMRRAALVNPQETLEVIQDDPADNRILEAAIAGAAEAILTGDKHLLRLKEFRGIQIMRASQI